ncbi:MAG: hypothetical protein WKF94_04475 [Solirubrobacteraceae bacterium]
MKPNVRAGIAGLLIALAAAPVAGAAAVTVRAEGFAATVLPETTVSNLGTDNTVGAKQFSCPTAADTGRSAAGALDRATASNWDGSSFSFGLTVERILTTDLGAFGAPTFWNFDVDNSSQQVGICDVNPEAGDEILFYEACASASATACFTGRPLDLIAPVNVDAGVPFTVSVREYDDTQSPASSAPAADATVAGGVAGAKTGSAGTARVTLDETGTTTLVATKGTQVRDSVTFRCRKGACLRIRPDSPSSAIADTTAPVSQVKSPRNRKVFKRRGPRQLRAAIEEAGSLASVKLALTWRVGRRCAAFRGDAERFARVKCGSHPRFVAGTDPQLSFLLPGRLGRGKYVFDVVATDAAGNTEALERGRNRVVFRVR